MEKTIKILCDYWFKFKSLGIVGIFFCILAYILVSPIVVLIAVVSAIGLLFDPLILRFIFYALRALLVAGAMALVILALLKYVFGFSII